MAFELTEAALQGLVQGAITLVLAAIGSFILWRFYGKRIVAKAVTKHGSDALWDALEDMSKDPQHPNHQRLARFVGTQFAWLMESISIDMESEEGRQKFAPVLSFMWEFIQASIYGAIGNFIKKAQTEGAEIGDLANLAVPDTVKGLANKFMPKRFKDMDLDIGDLITAAQWASQFLGKGSGNGGASPMTIPSTQGHRGGGLSPGW